MFRARHGVGVSHALLALALEVLVQGDEASGRARSGAAALPLWAPPDAARVLRAPASPRRPHATRCGLPRSPHIACLHALDARLQETTIELLEGTPAWLNAASTWLNRCAWATASSLCSSLAVLAVRPRRHLRLWPHALTRPALRSPSACVCVCCRRERESEESDALDRRDEPSAEDMVSEDPVRGGEGPPPWACWPPACSRLPCVRPPSSDLPTAACRPAPLHPSRPHTRRALPRC